MAASNNNNKKTAKQQSTPKKNSPNIRSFRERGKSKVNPEKCDCKTLVKNQNLGKVIAFSAEKERGLGLTHTAPVTPLSPTFSSSVSKHSLPDWGCSRKSVRGSTSALGKVRGLVGR